ncbi:MAG: hypothetical protein PHY92_07485, partial [Alphaproteobacteria bacterium]|nr:hypothetical protein [Alphaproteobacteria bacterium]
MVKFTAPALLIAILVVVIEVTFLGMVGNLEATIHDIVNHKYNDSLFLAQNVDRLRSADSDLHILQIKKAANLPQKVDEETNRIVSNLDQVSKTLSANKADYVDPSHIDKINNALANIIHYKDAVNFVGSMLEIDFNATVNFILPLSAVYNKTIGDLTSISNEFLSVSKKETQQLVEEASYRIRI